jgi:RNA polymerase sigma-70 factor (sigma-E family)
VTFEEFVAARLGALIRYATALTGEPYLAQDIVQDVMVKMHARWRRITAMDQPELYVRRAITNEFLSWRRRWSVRHLQTRAVLPEQVIPDPTLQRSDSAEVWQQLATLPRQQRVVLVLSYYEGLADAEIADMLDCAVGTVRGYKSRALATLRAALTDPTPAWEAR